MLYINLYLTSNFFYSKSAYQYEKTYMKIGNNKRYWGWLKLIKRKIQKCFISDWHIKFIVKKQNGKDQKTPVLEPFDCYYRNVHIWVPRVSTSSYIVWNFLYFMILKKFEKKIGVQTRKLAVEFEFSKLPEGNNNTEMTITPIFS